MTTRPSSHSKLQKEIVIRADTAPSNGRSCNYLLAKLPKHMTAAVSHKDQQALDITTSVNKGLQKTRLSGYITTAVVSVLAILSLLATRVTIGVTVDAYRVAGINQGFISTLFAGEVALKDSVTRIGANLGDLSGNPTCFNHDFGSVTVTDADSGLARDYQMEYFAEYIETRNSRDIYRVYATAETSIFKSTVSQIVSIDTTAATVYLLPGTWSDTLATCS